MRQASMPAVSRRKASLGRRILMNWKLYVLLLPALIYFPMFRYAPMYGIQIAFKNYKTRLGIMGSPWVGFEHFERLFNSYAFGEILINTIVLSLEQLLFSFIAPVILALSLNTLRSQRLKRAVQTITYAPHFISTVILVSMLGIFFNYSGGLVNELIKSLGGSPVMFLGKEQYFRPVYVLSGLWQNTGWSAIIYIAALSGVNPELHEAARIDGAGILQRIRHIDIPHILPTMVIMLILSFGQLMSMGSEKVLLMQNDLNIGVSEIISTYVYKRGILKSQYEFSTAVDLFNSVVNLILLSTVNFVARRVNETSLF